MKKILTLLIATGTFVTLHAQSREETRRVILGDGNGNGTYSGRNDRDVVLGRGGNTGNYPNGTYSTNRQYEIDRVNREYSDKINSIRKHRYLSNSEKERAIRDLERDRQRRIEQINRNNSGRNDRYDKHDRYDRDDRYDRRDNGKHKGWYKNAKNKNWKKGKKDRD